MSYRSGGGITGTNNVPLGTRRRFGGTDGDASPVSATNETPPSVVEKRGRSPVRADCEYLIHCCFQHSVLT